MRAGRWWAAAPRTCRQAPHWAHSCTWCARGSRRRYTRVAPCQRGFRRARACMPAWVILWTSFCLLCSPLVPYALTIMLGTLLGGRGKPLYRIARAWLSLCISGARVILGIRANVIGMENLPQGENAGAVLLVKHQSTYETFLMPAIMPRPLAYVFKKELLRVPFFGWAIGRLDMIHIDRDQRTQAFHKVVQQGKDLLAQGIWIIMFPEGTRLERGKRGNNKPGGPRLAIDPGAPVSMAKRVPPVL